MIDLRSDTVTRPVAAMRQAMLDAPVGDDVYGEDPTVNELEALSAAMTGKAAALFVASGTQSNLLALLTHCQRGEEYIAGQEAHTYRLEGGGGAVLGGIQPQPLPFNERGELDLDQVRAAIKPDNFHFAMTRLVCLENTQAGKVLALDYLSEFSALLRETGLAGHLDGARLFNAAVNLNVPASEICRHFDSVSFCLSKSLGCPVGSVLVGDTGFIQRARRWRKMLGGGMRQAGILAAAGIYALNHHIERLNDDHTRAARLGDALTELGMALAMVPQTNMVTLDDSREDIPSLQAFLACRDIIISGPRWVTHLDQDDHAIDQVIDACRAFVAGR